MHTPITIDLRILTREEATEILAEGLQNHFPGAAATTAEKVLDVLSKKYVLLLCPNNQPYRLGDEA